MLRLNLTSEQIEVALQVAHSLANTAGVPVGTGSRSIAIQQLEHTLSGAAGSIPASDAVKKAIDASAKLQQLFHYAGTVETIPQLPPGAIPGDVFFVVSENQGYAWNGKTWQPVGSILGLPAQIDALKASKQDTLIPGAGIKMVGATISAAQPTNLLDNSDFRHPVNQREQITYTGNGYSIDRWVIWEEDRNIKLSVNDGYIQVERLGSKTCSFGQYFEKGILDPNKKYTFAYKYINGTIAINNNPIWYRETHDQVEIGLRPTEDKVMKLEWAAMYEGEYTAETLPEYQPKGYAAELAECQRYYTFMRVLVGVPAGTPKRIFYRLPLMRIAPTATYEILDGTAPDRVYLFGNNTLDVAATEGSFSHLYIQLSADL